MRLELVTVLDTRNFKTDIQLFWYITSAYIAGLTEKQVKNLPLFFYPAMPALSLFQNTALTQTIALFRPMKT